MTAETDRFNPQQEELEPRLLEPRLLEMLTAAWSTVLAGIPVAPDDDVFALGGHSLLVGQVALRCRAALGLDIPFAWFFEHPTSRGLARAVAAAPDQCRSRL